MKITLIRVKENESDNKKHENDTRENKGAQRCKFEKLTEIEVKTSLEVRNYQCQCIMIIEMG